jgi:hypothetical protein
VAATEEAPLQTALEKLAEADILFVQGLPPEADYRFKHALIQDAAYENLLKSRRQVLHRRIAEAFEGVADHAEAAPPVVIAHHLAEAGFVERAIVYLREAAHAATKRWANAEAAGHLTRARELAARHPDAAARAKTELAVLLELGPVLATVRGVASDEVEEVYRRAHTLCRDVTEPTQLFAVKWGLWNTEHHHNRFEAARRWADELLDLAQSSADRSLLLQAHHCAWTSLFVLGENQRALNHAEEGIQLYDINAHREHGIRYGGHDPGVCAHMMGGMAAWFAGFPDRAAAMSAKAIELGRILSDPFSWAMALSFGATVAAMRREPAVVTERGAALQRLLDSHQLTLGHFGSTGKILTGWAIAVDGRPDEGRSLAEAGVEEIRRSGYRRMSFQLGFMAAVYRMAKDTLAALKTVDEALQFCHAQGEARWYSLLLHEKSVLLADLADPAGAEQALTTALSVARQQQVRSPELRVATRLAQLLSGRGRQREAGDLLRPVYGWFTEGFDTEDLKEARELLAAL